MSRLDFTIPHGGYNSDFTVKLYEGGLAIDDYTTIFWTDIIKELMDIIPSATKISLNEIAIDKVVITSWCHSGPVSINLFDVDVHILLERILEQLEHKNE